MLKISNFAVKQLIMKTKLLLGVLLSTFGLSAQTTHHVNWSMAVTTAQASMTIHQGDIVTWTLTDASSHTVSSIAGGAETFNSGTLSGQGETYSHTFTVVGATSYQCNFHNMMNGVITVDAVAGIEENTKIDFEYFPNPTTDILTINAKDIIDSIEIYDVNGRQIMNSKSGNTTSKIYMANYNAGTYFVKVIIGNKTENITVIKK